MEAASKMPNFQRYTYSGLEPALAFDVVYGGTFEHRLLAANWSRMEHCRLVCGEMMLESGAYDFPVVARGAMPKGSLCIGMMADGAETTRYNTASIADDEIQIYPSGADLLYQASAASRWVNLNIGEERLQEAAILRCGRTLNVPRISAGSLRLRRGRRSQLVRMADDLLAIASAAAPLDMSADLASSLFNSLLDNYIDALAEADSGSLNGKPARSTRQASLVLFCEQLVLSGDISSISLDELAQRCGYTRRSLEMIFKRSVGMPPSRWFTHVRLNGALRDLLNSRPDCRIADVAQKWGFRHLARFSDYYRKAFGELPSQTIHRVHS